MSRINSIKFVDVTINFNAQDEVVTALSNVSFAIDDNSFTIIYGPSGSGKTTILNMILGLLPPTRGKVLVNGVDIYALDQDQRAKFRAEHYGTVYQTNDWVKSLNCAENVALPLYLTGQDRSSAMKQAVESLRRVGMEKYAYYSPSVLSGGQQQRVSFARASIEAPPFLIADEPTGNLDSKNGDAILKLLTSFKNQQGSTVVLVTHNLDYLSLSDNRLFIKDGELTQESGVYMQNLRENVDQNVVAAILAKAKREVKLGTTTQLKEEQR